MISLVFYILIFLIGVLPLAKISSLMQQDRFIIRGRYGKELQEGTAGFVVVGLIALLPVILLYGFRINIGTDYWAYETVYDFIKETPFSQYLGYHFIGDDDYYCEIGFALLNKIMPSYRTLLFVEGILGLLIVLWAVYDFRNEVNAGFAIYIFLCTQFIYFMNGVRFLIAACFMLLAVKFLVQNKSKEFFLCILAAALFHKTALFCIIFYFIKEFGREEANKFRNFLLVVGIALFPLLLSYVMRMAGYVPAFSRYFSKTNYAAEFGNVGFVGFGWLMHIIPVCIPLFLLGHYTLLHDEKAKILFRVYLLEIPFRMVGLLNTWYTRFSRFPQMIEVILIPYTISLMQNRRNKKILIIYYVIWYAFYFCYYAVVNDGGDSLPYQSILESI
ncbi:EpsG family protein [Candidatus Weimeria sp. HCP3S3_B5]|uniref:EpsG family protein n=1 Tax=Candidatus Weimeria sp. HCP3S3_B5 TaxID=3438871 RepID=UPI003F8C7026